MSKGETLAVAHLASARLAIPARESSRKPRKIACLARFFHLKSNILKRLPSHIGGGAFYFVSVFPYRFEICWRLAPSLTQQPGKSSRNSTCHRTGKVFISHHAP